MQLDGTHCTVSVLQQLLGVAHIAGGSFLAWLPPVGDVPPAERERTFQEIQHKAEQQCLSDLLRVAGLPTDTEIEVRTGGDRNWPAGFVGSLTHKGTVVLATLAPLSTYRAIGIDLERIEDPQDRELDQRLIAPEGIPPLSDSQLATLIVFSAKEAVFKAQYPHTRQPLDFPDVILSWHPPEDGPYRAMAQIPGGNNLEVRSSVVQPWIISVAFAVS